MTEEPQRPKDRPRGRASIDWYMIGGAINMAILTTLFLAFVSLGLFDQSLVFQIFAVFLPLVYYAAMGFSAVVGLDMIRKGRVRVGWDQRMDYQKQLGKLGAQLQAVSTEIDEGMEELEIVRRERAERIRLLGVQVDELSERESELQARIDALSDVPLPVAEYFTQQVELGEKRSALRDYVLFALSVILGLVIGLLFEVVSRG